MNIAKVIFMLRITTKSCRDAGCPNCLLLNICLHEPARQVGKRDLSSFHHSVDLILRTQCMFSSELPLLEKHSGKFEIRKEMKSSSLFTTLEAFLTITQGLQIHFGQNPTP